jgi:hypothetical protein
LLQACADEWSRIQADASASASSKHCLLLLDAEDWVRTCTACVQWQANLSLLDDSWKTVAATRFLDRSSVRDGGSWRDWVCERFRLESRLLRGVRTSVD